MPTIKKTVGQITLKVLTDVKSTTYYYLLQSSMAPAPSAPTTNPPGSSWSTTEPEFFAYIPTQDTSVFPGKDYYTRSGSAGDYTYTIASNPTGNPSTNSYYEKIYGDTRSLYVTVQTFYTDNTFEYSTPSLSSSYEAAKEAYNRAKTALDLAGDSKQYFWEQPSAYSASVPAGVYVTHIPQSQFKSSPAQGNILIQDTGITIRNGAISLASLTGSALNFYNPSTHQANATLSSGGLVLSKGGINAGSYSSSATDDNQDFVYLSSENYGIGIKIGDSLATKDDWRQIIGNKFGVDKAGNLYAAGAHVDGNIIAQSLTVGSGSSAYDGMAAINISGYDIEITSDSTGVVDSDNTTYLYPHLYHNGVEITTGINYSHFIWYQDGVEPGTAGDANNQGRYLATYGHNYRVTYDFDDGAVSGGTQVQTRTIDPSKYITKINDTGITIHPEVWTNQSSYIQLTGSGMELFNSSGISIAKYGEDIRLGNVNKGKLLITAGGQGHTYEDAGTYIIDENDNISAQFLEDGVTIYGGASGRLIAHLGYGPGADSGGSTSNAPYYTLGVRDETSPIYSGVGNYSVAEGNGNIASEYCSHAEGRYNASIGFCSHSEGSGGLAEGAESHTEGIGCHAKGLASHAEGGNTTASGDYSHAEGYVTTASGYSSHAEGGLTTASGISSHAEGSATTASGNYSHAQNRGTDASKRSQTALGTFNEEDTSATTTHPSGDVSYGQYAVIVGNGTSESARSNALTVDWNGNVDIAPGALYSIGGVSITDYIIEQGTNNNWTYRKWNSGTYDAWQTIPSNIAMQTTWGNWYTSATSSQIQLPSFSSSSGWTISGSVNGGEMFRLIAKASTSSPPYFTYALAGPASRAASARSVSVIIHGTWK